MISRHVIPGGVAKVVLGIGDPGALIVFDVAVGVVLDGTFEKATALF